MGPLDRRRFVLGLTLVLCLALLGRWVMLPENAVNAPPRTEKLTVIDVPREAAQPPAIAEPASTTKPLQGHSAAPFGTFRGRVIDATTREPVREFELEFLWARAAKTVGKAPGKQTFRTNDGRFEWQQVPVGAWLVTASASGYQRFELNGLQIHAGKTTPEIVLPLRTGHKLRGRVYDETSGAGIASANIGFRESDSARFEGNWRWRVRVTSEKNGSFVLDGVPPGRVTLEIGAENYAAREVSVAVADATSPLQIGLSSGGTLSGHLTTADGVTPVAGTAGLFHLDQGFGGTSRTGKAGEFSFQHLAAGRYQITGQAQGVTATQEFVLSADEHIEGIVLALKPGRSIRGTVTGLGPEDLKRVSVAASRDGSSGFSLGEAGVDDHGTYALHGIQPGLLHIAANVTMRRQLSRTIQMPADSDVTVNFDFPRGVRLSGRVTRDGKPLQGLWVQPRPAVAQEVYIYGARTSAKGEYAIEDMATGEYNVWVDRYRSRSVQISGDTVFDIEVPRAHLAGRVLEEETKAPVVGADVEIWSAEPGSSRIWLGDRSDHFGRFALAALEPGDFILAAYKPGYAMFRERISYASPVTDMTITLRQDAGVEIQVRVPGNDKPLRQLFAYEMIGDRNGSKLQLSLDENGIGHLPAALAGSTIGFSASGYSPIVIHGWSGRRLDLQLKRQQEP